MTLTAEDRESVQADLDFARRNFDYEDARPANVGRERERGEWLKVIKAEIVRLERMLEDG